MINSRISGSVGGQQGRSWLSLNECGYSINQVFKDRAALQGMSADHGPHPLTIALAILSARALGDTSVMDYKPDSLLGRIVGRIDSGSGDEGEILFTIAPETIRHGFDVAVCGQGPTDPLHRG